MAALAAVILAFLLNPYEVIALRYAECHIITRQMGPDTVAVKWICPN